MPWSAVFSDNFNRADGNVDNGWTGTFDATFQILSNRLDTLGGTYASVKAMAPTGTLGKQKAECKFTLSASKGSSLLCIRQQAGAISQYAAGIGGDVLYVYKINAGSTSVLNNSAALGTTGSADYIVTISADGNAISATVAAAATPSTIIATVNTTDSAFATGTCGLAGNDTNSFVDDFVAYEFIDLGMSIAPTSVQARGSAVLTVTGTGTTWLTVGPDFEASAGTIGTVTVLSDTSATIAYTAPAIGQEVTITDNTSTADATITIQAPVVVFEGNSLVTLGFAPLVTYIVDGLSTDVDDYNVATSGQTLETMLSDYAAQVGAKYNSVAAKNIVAIPFCVTNDFFFERAIEDVQDDWIAYCAAAHADGFLVLCTTEIDRRNVGNPVTWRADIEAWNTWMRSTGKDYADAFVDVASEPLLGADGASDNTTYFNADKVHLNNTGAQLAADMIAPALQRLITGSGAGIIGSGIGGYLIGV